MRHALHDLRMPGPTLVLADDVDSIAIDALRGIEEIPGLDAEVVGASTLTGPSRGWGSVLVVAADRSRLRRVASGLHKLGQCRAVACWLTDTPHPWVLSPRPDWPPLAHLTARPAGNRGVLTVVRFDAVARAQKVVMEMARQAAGPCDPGHLGVVTAYVGRSAAPGLDPRTVLLDSVSEAGDADRDVPPDVVIAPPGTKGAIAEHHVIDRSPMLVTDALPDPFDEAVFNPIGFRKDWSEPLVDLSDLTRGPVTEAVIAKARAHQGVRVDAGLTGTADLLALAASGVPLEVWGRPEEIAPPLIEALLAPVDLDDTLRREEHSLRVRRSAFDHHSTLAWRSSLADRAGLRRVGLAQTSVVLATRRPDMLEFALSQVARQRGADVELVLAAHGFEPDAEVVRRVLGERSHQILTFDESTFFGDVLAAAAAAASAQVLLKMDDDDWYAPDAVHDLLMARRFSGADVVGMPSEYVHLEESDVTVRRTHPSEIYARFVAGGTLMFDKGVLDSLGGFRRVRRFVDAQLLAGVEAAGGRIYRTHGLGYVLRRTAGGHTWVRDAEDFRRPEIVDTQWPGFEPSRAMEHDPMDGPDMASAPESTRGGE